jgi:hypothetical protein
MSDIWLPSAGIIDTTHHAHLIYWDGISLFVQAGLDQNKITGMHHHTWPSFIIFLIPEDPVMIFLISLHIYAVSFFFVSFARV